VVALVAADLLVAGWGLNPGRDATLYQAGRVATSLPADTGGLRVFVPEETEQELKFQRYLRFDTFQPEGGWEGFPEVALPNLAMLRRTTSANNFDPLLPARYTGWMAAFPTATPAIQERMLSLMGVGWLEVLEGSQPGGARFTRLADNAGEEAVPPERVRWLPCSKEVSGADTALGEVLDPAIDLSTTVILEGSSTGTEPCATGGNANLQVAVETASRLVIYTRSELDGWLLLADAWYPGWVARIDGKSVPLLHGDYLFRAVQLPAGEHAVEFVYRPAVFYAGAAVSAMAMLLFAAGLGLVLRTRLTGPKNISDREL
jgi:hypothetical protein